LRHLAKCFVGLQKFLRGRIDKGDADRHVGEDLFAENNFALDPAGGFRLAAIKNSTKPGKDCSKSHQQARQHGHVANQIMHRFVSDGFGLSDYNGPSGRLD